MSNPIYVGNHLSSWVECSKLCRTMAENAMFVGDTICNIVAPVFEKLGTTKPDYRPVTQGVIALTAGAAAVSLGVLARKADQMIDTKMQDGRKKILAKTALVISTGAAAIGLLAITPVLLWDTRLPKPILLRN